MPDEPVVIETVSCLQDKDYGFCEQKMRDQDGKELGCLRLVNHEGKHIFFDLETKSE